MRPYSWSVLCLLGLAACSTPQKPAQDPNASGYDGSMVPAAALTASAPISEPSAPSAIDESRPETGDAQNSLPPKDQGKSQSDLITSQRIREAVILNESLSPALTNLRIITSEGKVTLRGTVSSARERAMVEDIAKEIAGPYNVDNKIELQSEIEENNE